MTVLPEDARTPELHVMHTPGDPAYELATDVFNPIRSVMPAEAVFVSSAGDVRAVMAYARRRGRRVHVLTTGHGASRHPPMDGDILIRMEPHGTIEIDPTARRALVPAGARWGEVAAAAAQHGLVTLHASSPHVGVIGFLLNGGLSWYSRLHGLGNSCVRAIDVVTPDAEIRHVTPDDEADLFAALLGASGGLGVVTRVEIDLYPAAALWTGAVTWPAAAAPAILGAWRTWQGGASEEIATSLRILRLPPDPSLPPTLTAGPVISVDGAAIAPTRHDLDAAEGIVTGLLRTLRAAGGEPIVDSWRPADAPDVTRTHLEPPGPLPYTGDHAIVGHLDDAFDDALLAGAGITGDGAAEPDWPLAVVELRQLGGAIGRPGTGTERNIDHLPGEAAYWAMGVEDPVDPDEEVVGALAASRRALAPWLLGAVAPSLVETQRSPGRSPGRSLGPEQLDRLARVAERVDPERIMADARARLLPA